MKLQNEPIGNRGQICEIFDNFEKGLIWKFGDKTRKMPISEILFNREMTLRTGLFVDDISIICGDTSLFSPLNLRGKDKEKYIFINN